MALPKKLAALTLGVVSALSAAASIAQTGSAPPKVAGDTLVIEEATVDWILKSDVSAHTDGVIDKVELDIGKIAPQTGAVIGTLYRKKAELVVVKAKAAAGNKGAMKKAAAQYAQAKSVVDRNNKLTKKDRNAVAIEEQEKAIAEVDIAVAYQVEADESIELAKAELALAQQQLDEHTIRAPFPGVVYERLKNPGESVRTGDAIVRMGNLDKLRVFAYIPLDYVGQVHEGCAVEIRPRISGVRNGTSGLEGKSFKGVITFVDPQIQPVAETAVRVYADFSNVSHELSPGLKVAMSIQLDPNPARRGRPAPAPAVATDSLPEIPSPK